MLKSFIRFTESDINPLVVNTCEISDTCGIPIYEYPLPAITEDIIKWQMLESELDTSVYDIADFSIGIVDSCGNLLVPGVGTIVEAGDGILQCSVVLHEMIEGCYRFIIYVDFNPVDCSIYEGSTVDDLIADGILLGDVLECIPVPNWV